MTEKKQAYFLNAMGLCCNLGQDKPSVAHALFSHKGAQENLSRYLRYDESLLQDNSGYYIGRVEGDLPAVPNNFKRYDSRNNQMLLLALSQIRGCIDEAILKYGKDRIAVVIGTSTSGIAEGELALKHFHEDHAFPAQYNFGVQEIADGSEFLADFLGLTNLAMTVSTACSSSAKIFAHATELIESGFCDAAIVGGMDSICQLTLNGFHSLGALSDKRANPFSRNRSGISIGEGGALFLLTTEPAEIALASVGESSDGYSMTAPEPDGLGAELSMKDALEKAAISPQDIAYVNLHGTGTTHNDSMEAKAVSRLFGDNVPCSSSKSIVGHTLGAAGSVETALCWLMLSSHYNPARQYLPHLWDGESDPEMSLRHFTAPGQSMPVSAKNIYILSNFCAFGGSNASVILKRKDNR